MRDTVAWLHATGRLTGRQAGAAAQPDVFEPDAGAGVPVTEEVLP